MGEDCGSVHRIDPETRGLDSGVAGGAESSRRGDTGGPPQGIPVTATGLRKATSYIACNIGAFRRLAADSPWRHGGRGEDRGFK